MNNRASELERILSASNIKCDNTQIDKLLIYADMLVDWNSRVNLTAITDDEGIFCKHFADSLLPLTFMQFKANQTLIDVGTGGGFPGIPLAIMTGLKVTLLDSLNKRVAFLDEVVKVLDLNCTTVHARAEDGARTYLRQSFDFATSRAVGLAPLLLEYTTAYLKIGGQLIAYKSSTAREEFSVATRAVRILGCLEPTFYDFKQEWGERCLVVVKKHAPTPKAYPRKAGTPAKAPIA